MRPLKPRSAAPLAVIAGEDADYERLALARDAVAPWEDGARTDNRRGTYEWWYFDAHLDDGSSLVVVFMNKDLAAPTDPLTPTIRLDLDLADGRSYQKLARYPRDAWHAASSHADVRIGDNRFAGDLHTYQIQVAIDEITVDVTLVGDVRAWRPQTGYLLYGARRDKEFAWLPSVPQGTVTASYRIGDELHETTGVGYHDHNWGNTSLAKVIHDWYWARGQAGPYSVIASLVTAHERYGYAELPIFMLARDGELVADDSRRVQFEALDTYVDEVTGKPVAAITRYTYARDDERWIVTFTRDRDLAGSRMIDDIHGPKRVLAQLATFDGAYLRFAGRLRIEHHRGDELVEQHTNDALWELMYFGHARLQDRGHRRRSIAHEELAMRRSRRPGNIDPHLLIATTAAAVVVILGIVALAVTGSYWFVAITLAAVIAGAAALAYDVDRAVTDGSGPDLPDDRTPDGWSGAIVPGPDFTGPSRPCRLLVVTSEPVDPRAILRAATSGNGDLALDRLGVMVVSPEGFGHLEVTSDERRYTRARDAQQTTVAGLRRAGVAAAGHVGDHDPARAVDDALVLFAAQRTLVFAHGSLAGAYRRRLNGRRVEVIELLDDPVPIRA